MQNLNIAGRLPKFLESFEDLNAHFDEHFGDLGSNARGDTFLGLALKVVSLASEGQDFPQLRASEKKSHDGGIDLYTAMTEGGRILCVQSKYKVRSKDELDGIISKFGNFESSLSPLPQQSSLFPIEQGTETKPVPTFGVVTSSKLEGVIAKYEASTLASCGYYRQLLKEKRLFFIDGPRILTLLQHLYKKAHLIPSTVTLRSKSNWNQCGGVYLGAVSGTDLAALYDDHGDALFFENI